MLPLVIYVLILAALGALFYFKYREVTRGEVFLGNLRDRADEKALIFKKELFALNTSSMYVPKRLVSISKKVGNVLAVKIAVVARLVERGAYKVADRLSHRHRFEKKATSSKFLKEVTEHKTSLTSSLDEGRKEDLM